MDGAPLNWIGLLHLRSISVSERSIFMTSVSLRTKRAFASALA
jgi:hypothetical protein